MTTVILALWLCCCSPGPASAAPSKTAAAVPPYLDLASMRVWQIGELAYYPFYYGQSDSNASTSLQLTGSTSVEGQVVTTNPACGPVILLPADKGDLICDHDLELFGNYLIPQGTRLVCKASLTVHGSLACAESLAVDKTLVVDGDLLFASKCDVGESVTVKGVVFSDGELTANSDFTAHAVFGFGDLALDIQGNCHVDRQIVLYGLFHVHGTTEAESVSATEILCGGDIHVAKYLYATDQDLVCQHNVVIDGPAISAGRSVNVWGTIVNSQPLTIAVGVNPEQSFLNGRVKCAGVTGPVTVVGGSIRYESVDLQ